VTYNTGLYCPDARYYDPEDADFTTEANRKILANLTFAGMLLRNTLEYKTITVSDGSDAYKIISAKFKYVKKTNPQMICSKATIMTIGIGEIYDSSGRCIKTGFGKRKYKKIKNVKKGWNVMGWGSLEYPGKS